MSEAKYSTIIAANHLYFCAPRAADSTANPAVAAIDINNKPGDSDWLKVGIVDGFTPNNEQEEVEITAPINFINQTVRKVSHTLKMKYDVALKSVDDFVFKAVFMTDFEEEAGTYPTGSTKNQIFVPGSKAAHEGWFKWMQVDPGDGAVNNKIGDDVILTILDVYGSFTVDGYDPKNTEGATPTLHITQLYSTKNKGIFNRNGIFKATAGA